MYYTHRVGCGRFSREERKTRKFAKNTCKVRTKDAVEELVEGLNGEGKKKGKK